MLIALTGLGFSAAAGLNAFIPLAALAVLSRFTNIIDLSPGFSWLSSWPVIIAALGLLVIELVLDKIPGVDTVNDVIQTPIRPAAGALAFAASATAHVSGTDQAWSCPMWVAWTTGILTALTVHLCKAASRTAIGAATGGSGTPLASFAEDGLALTLCLFSLILPIVVLPVLIGMGIGVYRIVTIGRRRRQRLAEKQRRWRAEREAAEKEAGFRGWLARPTRRLRARVARNGNGKVRNGNGKVRNGNGKVRNGNGQDSETTKARRYRRTSD
ncbi:MAG: DUF4126 domain-containing protein [Demequinaceae bacterium]|nr:DUF4126 domain-containing protein [Demequinaceae bacterium]